MQKAWIQVAFARYDISLPIAEEKVKASLSPIQYRKWRSRRTADFLLRQLLEAHQQDSAVLDRQQKTASGRPYLPNSPIDFNLSHSGEWVAVIVSCSAEKKAVGIDIEQPQKARDYHKLLRHYATPAETAEIAENRLLPELRGIEPRFYLSWCLREAVLKAQGAGLVRLSSVTHSLRERKITTPYCPQGTLCFHYDLPFYLAYFVEQTETPVSISEWQAGGFQPVDAKAFIHYQVN